MTPGIYPMRVHELTRTEFDRRAFAITGPACISFSGGRTSAFMLWQILEAHGGTLPDDVVVCFANTGKEMPQTLDFVEECSRRWGVKINWLEYRPKIDGAKQFAIVNHATASRNGEPFEALIRDRCYLPNPVSRFCTTELKIRPTHQFLRVICGFGEWVNAIGIRADEERRLAKLRGRSGKETRDEVLSAPLTEAGITRHDVAAFWAAQPFDLLLPNVDGTTPLGNCDLCFLKGATRITSILRERPELGEWWARMEDTVAAGFGIRGQGGTFRSDRPRYSVMLQQARDQRTIFDDEPIGDCMCVD